MFKKDSAAVDCAAPVNTRKLLLVWISALAFALLFIDDSNWFGYFPTMVVHELGHALFSWMAGVPMVSFFFASFAFSNEPVLSFVGVLAAIESFALWRCSRKRLPLSVALLVILLISHLYFLFNPQQAVPFFLFGGVGGEFLLPLILLIVVTEHPPRRLFRWIVAFAFGSFVFWRSTLQWSGALLGWRPIPYPRDSSGAVGLFQDPFLIAEGVPIGDIDKLIRIYGWSESTLIRTYVLFAYALVLIFSLFWVWYCWHAPPISHSQNRSKLTD